MHIFSAIPDINYDKKAGIKTTAVIFGKKPSLALCSAFWIGLTSLTIFLTNFHPMSFIILIYPIIPLIVLTSEKMKIEKVYWFLPYVNTGLGGLLFTFLMLEIIL